MATFSDLLTAEETQASKDTKLEGTVFELRKVIGLLTDANPNVLDLLWCRSQEIRFITPLGEKLRGHRDLFLSAKMKFTLAGYSHAQLKRIKSHRAHLMNPPSHKPTRAEFNLPERTLIPSDQLAAANAAIRKQIDSWEVDYQGMSDAEVIHTQGRIVDFLTDVSTALGYTDSDPIASAKWDAAARTVGLDDNLILVLQREREYASALAQYKQYEDWKKNRNPERAALEEKYGCDTKHASHLVRLLRMGREVLTQGKVYVWRGPSDDPHAPNDAEELRAIRNGAWTYERLIEWATAEDEALNKLYNERAYVVPKQPDRDALDKLCVEMLEASLRV
jgi:predicted nucleotidyltransferase